MTITRMTKMVHPTAIPTMAPVDRPPEALGARVVGAVVGRVSEKKKSFIQV